MAEKKTNAMRILDRMKIKYTAHEYDSGGTVTDGLSVAEKTGLDPDRVFKTLVTKSASKTYCVFVIPCNKELDLKKAARAAGEKSVEMIHVSEINSVTGYIRGGCSPIGMKKQYRTYFDNRVNKFETVTVSAGKIGCQIEAAPEDLLRASCGSCADITADG